LTRVVLAGELRRVDRHVPDDAVVEHKSHVRSDAEQARDLLGLEAGEKL